MEYFQILELRGGGCGGWSIFRFLGFDGGEWWVEYFQILGFPGWVGVVDGVFSDFRASRRREWWVEYFHILGIR